MIISSKQNKELLKPVNTSEYFIDITFKITPIDHIKL